MNKKKELIKREMTPIGKKTQSKIFGTGCICSPGGSASGQVQGGCACGCPGPVANRDANSLKARMSRCEI